MPWFQLKMHQNAFGGRATPGLSAKLTALPQTPSWIQKQKEQQYHGKKIKISLTSWNWQSVSLLEFLAEAGARWDQFDVRCIPGT